MTKQEINERCFGDSILSKMKLNKKDSKRALKILTAKPDHKKINKMIKKSKKFFEEFDGLPK